ALSGQIVHEVPAAVLLGIELISRKTHGALIDARAGLRVCPAEPLLAVHNDAPITLGDRPIVFFLTRHCPWPSAVMAGAGCARGGRRRRRARKKRGRTRRDYETPEQCHPRHLRPIRSVVAMLSHQGADFRLLHGGALLTLRVSVACTKSG